MEEVREKSTKRKLELGSGKCFDCGLRGQFIAWCLKVICFQCQGVDHRVPECPWNFKNIKVMDGGASGVSLQLARQQVVREKPMSIQGKKSHQEVMEGNN